MFLHKKAIFAIFAVCFFKVSLALAAGIFDQELPKLPDPSQFDKMTELRAGAEAYNSGRYKEAAEIFEEYLSVNPDNPTAQFFVGMTYVQLERYNSAEWYLSRSIEGDPDRKEAYLALSHVLLKLEKFDAASGPLEKLIEYNPYDSSVLSVLATVYYQTQQFEKAEGVMERLTELHPDLAEAWYNYGVVLAQNKKYRESLDSFLMTRQLEPEYDRVNFYIGLIAFEMQEFDTAKESLERAVERNPDMPQIYSSLGAIYGKDGDYEKAEEFMLKAIKMDPDDKVTIVNLIIIYANQQKTDEAAELVEASLEKWPEDTQLMYTAAVIWVHKDKFKESRDILENLLKITPRDEKALKLLASLYEQSSDVEKSISTYRRLLELNPSNVEPRNSLARILKRSERNEEALEEYKKIIGYDPGHFEAWRSVAKLLEILERKEELEEHYKKMAEAIPDNGFALVRLGMAAEENGDMEAAVGYYDEAMRREDAGDLNVFLRKAKINEEEGEFIRAELVYRKGLIAILEHSREVYLEIMEELQSSGGSLSLNQLIEIGEREEGLDELLDGAIAGVVSAFNRRDDLDSERDYFQKLMDEYPNNKKLVRRMAELERERGDDERVLKLSEALLKIDKKDSDGHLWMAEILEKRGDIVSAGLEYLRAVESDLKNEEAYEKLIENYKKQGKLKVVHTFLKNKYEDNKDKDIEQLENALSKVSGLMKDQGAQ